MAKKAPFRSRSSTVSAAPTVPDWQRTYLWKTLEQRARKPGSIHAKALLHTVETWMGQLDTVLRSGGTSPEDFTLHNDQHAFRVAERMAKLFTPAVQRNISDYELALLLLAAYGHDVGMTPERQQVARHHRHLFSSQDSQLSAAEQQQFQEFIDNYPARAVTLPLTSSIDDLNLADELTTYYVRDRHNQWSGDWLRDNLHDNLAHLQDTVPALIRLCQSHHWGFDRLARSDFDPLLSTGPQPQLIHLRNLACLLRLADILENDPERTPEVIFRHRSIQDRPQSLTHWIKDHHFTIDEQENQLVIVAHPPTARIHHAIEQLADWIDHELRGIAAFGEKLPVEYKVGRDTIRREWHLAPALIRRIQPQPGTYRYIDGAFRPNTQRLLQLLSNEQLYGKPIVAVRELLQNAFDAVREKIARRRLEPHITDKADRKWEALLGDQEKVTLTLRRVTQTVNGKEEVQHHLICDDTGVGLTEKLITGHLLVSGQSRRHAILDLERRCQEAGFPLGRTGQFGIGVLSYFMLAREVRLTTTRYQGCGDADNQSWHFHTHGLSDFGELRPASTTPFPTGGTRIKWHLRPEQIGDPDQFAEELRQYLRDTLIRIPCQFEFKVEGYPQPFEGWHRPTGWTRTLEEWKEEIVEAWKSPDEQFKDREYLLSPEDAARQQAERAAYTTALAEAAAVLNLEETEVPLPDGLGWTRLILPWFNLPRGRSLFFPIIDAEGWTLIERIDGLAASSSGRTAWRGMACEVQRTPKPDEDISFEVPVRAAPPAFVAESDVQLVDRATLEVSRAHLILTHFVADALRGAVATAATQFADRVLECAAPNFFGELNLAIQHRELTLNPGAVCFVEDGRTALRFLSYPLTIGHRHQRLPLLGTFNAEEKIQELQPSIRMGGRDECNLRLPSPDRLCCLPWPTFVHQPFGPLQCWEQDPGNRHPSHAPKFPDEWRSLAVVGLDGKCVALQFHHPVVALLSSKQCTDLVQARLHELRPNWQVLADSNSVGEIAYQLIRLTTESLASQMHDHWRQFQTNRPERVWAVWQILANAARRPLSDLIILATDGFRTTRLSPDGFVHWSYRSKSDNPLPKVTDPEFLLVEVKS